MGHKKPEDLGWGRGRRPVIFVSSEDAEAYCVWLSKETGNRYYLPSETEWEYACSSGATTAYAFGDDLTKEQANFGKSLGKTSKVGIYPANAFGLFDMHGNIWEWCGNCWYAYEYIPTIGRGVEPMVRGGSWSDDVQALRSACRSSFHPDHRRNNLGFRCARVLVN